MTRKSRNRFSDKVMRKIDVLKTAREFSEAPAFAQCGPTREEET
jgi:hypothetical protein